MTGPHNLKPERVVKALERAGWTARGQKGSHVKLTMEGNPHILSIPVHKGKPIKQGLLRDQLEKVKTALAPTGGSRREMPQKRRLAGKTEPGRIVRAVASSCKLSEEEILKKSFRGEARQVLMELLYRHGGMNNREIGEMLGVDYSTVSVGRKRLGDRMERDGKLRRRVGELQEELGTEQ